jgi:HEAT repeat protein
VTQARVLGSRCRVPNKTLLISLGCVVFATTLAVAQGRISNANIETRAVTTTLEREVQSVASQGRAVWIGYRTAMIPGERHMCCSDSVTTAGTCCGVCRLDSGRGVTMSRGSDVDPGASRIVLEPPADVLIMARIENGAIIRLRTFTPDCDIDGSALPIVWFENVRSGDSEAWLTALARSDSTGDRDRDNRVVRPAISALAVHQGQSAVTTLVSLARDDRRPSIRSHALFWLSQRAGQQAVSTISAAVESDPEVEVKKRAVFALSQLPPDEGIPLLIQLARTHRNVEVRRQAMFWLGQTKDQRAVSFFEEILQTK